MKTYKTTKELPRIKIDTEFAYRPNEMGGYGVTLIKGDNIEGLLDFINGFGLDCGYFEEVKPKSHKRFRAEKGGRYYYIDVFGSICVSEDDGYTDSYLYDLGNYYRTKEEATFARDRQLFITKVNDRIMELNAGWVWEAGDYTGYIVCNSNGVSFISTDIIHSSLFIKMNRGVGATIINEFHDDLLKYIFN